MKKILVFMLVLLLSLTAFTGCKEKVTAEGIMLKVNANTKDAKSMAANMVMNMDMSYDMEGVTGNIAMLMDMDMDIQIEPMAMYMNMAMTMDADGMTEEQNYEIYAIAGENEEEVQVYTGMDDMWYVETAAASEYADMSEQMTLAAGFAESEDVSFELAEETEDYNGQEVYVLNGTMKGETLQTMMSSVQELEELLGTEVDLSDAEAAMSYKVYKESFMPAEMYIDMSEFMSGLLAETGFTFNIVTIQYVFESFDDTAVAVPEDVAANALDASALSEEDVTVDSEYEEDVLINTADTTIAMTAAGADAPVPMNEWGSTYTLLEDGTYFQVGVRVVGIERGETVDNLVASINDAAGSEVLGVLHENLEYCLVGYEVYVPNDYPDEAFQGIELYITDTEGLYFETEYEFDDMYWVEVVDDSNMYVGPGETAQIVGIFTMEKDRTEYLFEIGDSWFNEVYVAVTE